MSLRQWIESIHTDTVAPWLEPAEPRQGDRVTIRIRIRRDAPIAGVFVRAILNGIDHHIPAAQERTGVHFAWYAARFRLEQPATAFHLLIRTTDERTLYWNRAGADWVYPNEDHDFRIDTRVHAPSWVCSSVFYQIFPDRFSRGDEHLGVADGEIRRGEFASRSMAWDRTPLPYPEGGSLDFFNGDLPGIEAKLDYLAETGVNALYLTPIFTAKTNHRYDCLDYFSVDAHLGGDAALASLLRAAHERGMKVVLDVSINHVGVEHEWAQGMEVDARSVRVVAQDADGTPVHWAGVPDLLKLDYTVSELREVIYRRRDSVVQRYLSEPFGIDGWRFDVASETANLRPHQGGHELWREIRAAIREINPEAYVIGEHWHDSLAYLQGDQWDSAMNYFASGRLLRLWLGEEDRFATVPSSEASAGRGISGTELRRLVEQHFTRVPSPLVHAQFNILDSHDVTRLHTNPSVFDWPVYEGAIMLGFLLPGTFSVYYGDEVGIGGSLDGDHGKRYPMPWNRDAWDPRFVSLYRWMIALKRGTDVLHRGSARVLDAGPNHLVYARFSDRRALVLILNREAADREHRVDLGVLGALSAKVIGPEAIRGHSVDLQDGSAVVALAARQSALIECELSD